VVNTQNPINLDTRNQRCTKIGCKKSEVQKSVYKLKIIEYF